LPIAVTVPGALVVVVIMWASSDTGWYRIPASIGYRSVFVNPGSRP
jgi:hypothetical protein